MPCATQASYSSERVKGAFPGRPFAAGQLSYGVGGRVVLTPRETSRGPLWYRLLCPIRPDSRRPGTHGTRPDAYGRRVRRLGAERSPVQDRPPRLSKGRGSGSSRPWLRQAAPTPRPGLLTPSMVACVAGRPGRGKRVSDAIASGGRLKDRYRLERTLGRGGMAAVWLGYDEFLDRPVAVKVLSDTIASDPGFLARFRREARTAARLAHPNLAGVYDFSDEGERPYLVMQFVPGENLASRFRRGERVDCDPLGRELLGRALAHPRGGDPAPRHQAGQHHHRTERDREADRFRNRPSPRCDRADEHGSRARHGSLLSRRR